MAYEHGHRRAARPADDSGPDPRSAPRATTRSFPSPPAATWRIASRAPVSSSCPGAIICRGWATRTPSSSEIQEFLTGVRGSPDADRILATVLFTDIVRSTERASELGDQRWRRVLDGHYALVRRALTRFRGREVKTTGDGVLASFDGPARAVRCAGAIIEGARQLDLEVRAGIHTGECEVRGDDLGGIAVHIGARIVALAGPGEVLVSSTVKDLVAGSGLEFEDRGRARAQGRTRSVAPLPGAFVRPNRLQTSLLLAALLVPATSPAANHPFASHPIAYAAGAIQPSHVSQAARDQAVRDFYDAWKARYLKQACGAGRYVVERSVQSGNLTVSEAHGYGMMHRGADGRPRSGRAAPSSTACSPTSATTRRAHARASDVVVPEAAPAPTRRATTAPRTATSTSPSRCCSPTSSGAAAARSTTCAEAQAMHRRHQGRRARRERPATSCSATGRRRATRRTTDATRSSDFMPDHFRSFAAATGDATWSDAARPRPTRSSTRCRPGTARRPVCCRTSSSTRSARPQPAPPDFLEGPNDGALRLQRLPRSVAPRRPTSWSSGDARAEDRRAGDQRRGSAARPAAIRSSIQQRLPARRHARARTPTTCRWRSSRRSASARWSTPRTRPG